MGHPHPRHPSNAPDGDPRSMPANDAYRENYDRIFGKKKPKKKPCEFDTCTCDNLVAEEAD